MTLGLGLTPIMQTLVFPQVLADSFLDADLGFRQLQCGGGRGCRSGVEKLHRKRNV